MDKRVVETGILILEKLKKIMDLYEEEELEVVLDKVYESLTTGQEVKLPSKKQNRSSAKKKNTEMDKEKINFILKQLETLEKEEMIDFLRVYTNPQLVEIGRALGLKMNERNKKDILMSNIMRNYTFDQLNKKMAKRYT